MKHMLNTLLVALSFAIFSVQGMNFIGNIVSKAKEKIAVGIHNFKRANNKEYNYIFVQYDQMRSILFENLKEEYKRSDATVISKEEILELKKTLKDKNTRGEIKNEDISACLMRYDDMYKRLQNEPNNIYFVDTILPVLLKGHSFESSEGTIGYCMGNDSIFAFARDNVHLMRTLIFNHNIPLKMTNSNVDSWTLHQLDRVEKIEKLYGSQQGYLQAILTPPATWSQNPKLQKIKKDIISSMCSFIIVLQELKQKNSNYNLPKAVIFNCILRELIKSSASQEGSDAYTRIANQMKADLELIKETEEGKHEVYPITEFLENGFEQWARNTINPETFLYNEIVNKKNTEKSKEN